MYNSLKDLLIQLVDAGALQLNQKLFNPRCNNYPAAHLKANISQLQELIG